MGGRGALSCLPWVAVFLAVPHPVSVRRPRVCVVTEGHWDSCSCRGVWESLSWSLPPVSAGPHPQTPVMARDLAGAGGVAGIRSLVHTLVCGTPTRHVYGPSQMLQMFNKFS